MLAEVKIISGAHSSVFFDEQPVASFLQIRGATETLRLLWLAVVKEMWCRGRPFGLAAADSGSLGWGGDCSPSHSDCHLGETSPDTRDDGR